MAARERPVPQSDVAKAAGVSRGLVSQAVSGGGRISSSTRAHIRETAEKLGYYPHSATAAYRHGLTLGTDLGIVDYDDINLARRPAPKSHQSIRIRKISLRRPSRRYSLHHLASRRR